MSWRNCDGPESPVRRGMLSCMFLLGVEPIELEGRLPGAGFFVLGDRLSSSEERHEDQEREKTGQCFGCDFSKSRSRNPGVMRVIYRLFVRK